MAPLTPTWTQPSHPHIQKVIYGTNSSQEFTSKSLSTVDLPPFAVYAKMDFPPCTYAPEATYATVQCGKGRHLNLNSDLVYINHSCEPSVIFETTTRTILTGPQGLRTGQELTFFYPSTEWDMAQGFQCLCSTPSCKGLITGAKDMTSQNLAGYYLNGHIRELLEEKNGGMNGVDEMKELLEVTVRKAREALESAESALGGYSKVMREIGRGMNGSGKEEKRNGVGKMNGEGVGGGDMLGFEGAGRRGVTSREMSGEMGGDTI
ncbi:hypothetical protein HYALB_00009295 [Hymenoscyphus albidus]|uniref:Post-SET domain-containing protein n=1 Tax=Hymenoscyphus albidus TaxID=595503 RepID=A0A9N9LNX2_9HELO|nr:hypothetical protein HYALB_00009295 [Hymenoscyphus albidus]